VEDQVLYLALQADRQSDLARLARHYQSDMVPIAAAYDAFARRWNTSQRVREDAQGFRDDANLVLRSCTNACCARTGSSIRRSRRRSWPARLKRLV
jgi:hypothetical protein